MLLVVAAFVPPSITGSNASQNLIVDGG